MARAVAHRGHGATRSAAFARDDLAGLRRRRQQTPRPEAGPRQVREKLDTGRLRGGIIGRYGSRHRIIEVCA